MERYVIMDKRYNFNGMTSRLEVLTSIKENIQDGDMDMAIDMINQMIELEPQPDEVKTMNKEGFYGS